MKAARASIYAVLVLAYGCGDSENFSTATSTTTGVTVKPGQSIQAAVDAASPGDTITVLPGDYTDPHAGKAAVRITKSLKLIAQSKLPDMKVRILPSASQQHGILVEPENDGDPDIDGIEITGFTVQGFDNNGIWLRHVNNFTIDNNESIDNLENGIFPTISANGLVKNNVAYGSQDSALWVEASENVRVIDNDIHHSPTGVEITVSKDITVQTNNIHNNTVGIGLYHPAGAGLPPSQWPQVQFGDWHILDNHVHDNNEPNSAVAGAASQLPPGGGILVLGVDRVDVQNNLIEDNNFFGVALVDWCIVTMGTDYACPLPPELPETAPDHDMIIKNTLVNNHGDPPDSPFKALASDILTLGGRMNCFSNNMINNTPPLMPVTVPSSLPGC